MSNTIPLPATPYVLGIAGDGYSDDHCTSFPAWDDGAMYDHAAAVSAADNAALRAELDEWRFTNKVDELDRHVARQAERDARIEALQTECDASNAEGIELTAQVAALREEVAEVLEQNRKCVFAVNEYNTAIQNLVAERDALRFARIAYANEFPLNADGEPDVGNIHTNIRAMKERIKALEDLLWVLAEHNELHFGKSHSTVIQCRAALGDKHD